MGLKLLMAIVLVSSAFSASSVEENENVVSFLTLAPYPGRVDPGWKGGPGVIPAVRLAVDKINNSTDVLPGYRVNLIEAESGCQNQPQTAFSFVANFYKKFSPDVVGIIGPACSESALLLGTLGARNNISLIQISPSATSPLLREISKYRNTYRTLSTTLQHLEAVTKLIAYNRWEEVALLHDSTRVYFRTTTELFLKHHSDVVGYHSEIYSGFYPLGSVETKYKVIIVIAGNDVIREALCLAYHHSPQILFPIYQWIIVDKSKDAYRRSVKFTYRGQPYNCSQEIMEQALEGIIFTRYNNIILHYHQFEDDKVTDVGLTHNEYNTSYTDYLEDHLKELKSQGRDARYDPDATDFALSYYDSTWALALALNASLNRIELSSYTYGQPETTKIIKEALNSLEFMGLMGPIHFDNNTQESTTPIILQQCSNGSVLFIGRYSKNKLHNISTDARFVTGRFHRRVVGVHRIATGVVLVLTAILAFSLVILHILFILYHNHKSIKAASFALSHFMFSGCYLILLQALLTALVFSYDWETHSKKEYHLREIILGVSCNTFEWLNNIGISLVMGTLCGKLWRLYRIFNHFNTKRFLISDRSLAVFISIIMSVIVTYLTVWNVFDPLLIVFEQQGIVYDTDSGEPIIIERGFCRCKYLSIWIYFSLLVWLLLGAAVVVLSSMNRRISRTYFKTAKSANLMVYLTAFACFLAVGLGYVFESLDIHYKYVSLETSLLSIVCTICLFQFSPPVYRVFNKRRFL